MKYLLLIILPFLTFACADKCKSYSIKGMWYSYRQDGNPYILWIDDYYTLGYNKQDGLILARYYFDNNCKIVFPLENAYLIGNTEYSISIHIENTNAFSFFYPSHTDKYFLIDSKVPSISSDYLSNKKYIEKMVRQLDSLINF